MISPVYIHSKKKNILILGKDPTDGLDDTTLIAEKEYCINFIEQQKKFCVILHHYGVEIYMFVNGVEIYKFMAKNSDFSWLNYG